MMFDRGFSEGMLEFLNLNTLIHTAQDVEEGNSGGRNLLLLCEKL